MEQKYDLQEHIKEQYRQFFRKVEEETARVLGLIGYKFNTLEEKIEFASVNLFATQDGNINCIYLGNQGEQNAGMPIVVYSTKISHEKTNKGYIITIGEDIDDTIEGIKIKSTFVSE